MKAPEKNSNRVKSQKERATEWLRNVLVNGPRPAIELFAEWSEFSGLKAGPKGRAERTLQEAAGLIGIDRNYLGASTGGIYGS